MWLCIRSILPLSLGLPRSRGQTFSLPLPLLPAFLLLVSEVHVFLSLFRRHLAPEFARGSRYHGDVFFRFSVTQSQEKDDERICRSNVVVYNRRVALAGPRSAARGLSVISGICAT